MAKSHPMLAPFKHSDADPWDRYKAAHLLQRAGFGGTREEISKVLELGPEKAVDWLMDFPDASAEEQSRTDVPALDAIEGLPKTFREITTMLAGKTEEEKKALRQQFMMANMQALYAIGSWWLKRMTAGPHMLQEKLTFFWHGHFTTSAKDERSALLMWGQNELLRSQCAGNFTTFVRKISRDPAMLDYLNNTQNRKAHPNENYARELMELFTLGIGNYTEDDIKQAARAFTGWTHDGDDFVFRKFQHDDEPKIFFGQRGNFDGDDIISMIMQHPACARYIASKVFKFFASEDLSDDLSMALGDVLRSSRYELRPLLRTIFMSKAFYDSKAIGTQIKSPIQLVIGTVRLLGRELPTTLELAGVLNQMGQVPLNPPNVKGWPGGRNWINTNTLFVRYNTCTWLAGGRQEKAFERMGRILGNPGPEGRRSSGRSDYEIAQADSCEQAVDHWVGRLIQRPVAPARRQMLIDSMDGRTDEPAVRAMIQLVVSTPEYQLC